MCSIVGSFDRETIVKLAKINGYRGQFSWSITMIDPMTNYCVTEKGLGELPLDKIRIPETCYCVVHQQAPTTQSLIQESIHPAQIDGDMLWHNGILKTMTIEKLQAMYRTTCEWDTKLLLKHFIHTDNLDDIDGSFACIAKKDNELYVFRNDIAPLFVDAKYTISSTAFNGGKTLQSNWLFKFDLIDGLQSYKQFKTVDNPYFMEI